MSAGYCPRLGLVWNRIAKLNNCGQVGGEENAKLIIELRYSERLVLNILEPEGSGSA